MTARPPFKIRKCSAEAQAQVKIFPSAKINAANFPQASKTELNKLGFTAFNHDNVLFVDSQEQIENEYELYYASHGCHT